MRHGTNRVYKLTHFCILKNYRPPFEGNWLIEKDMTHTE